MWDLDSSQYADINVWKMIKVGSISEKNCETSEADRQRIVQLLTDFKETLIAIGVAIAGILLTLILQLI